MDILDNANNGNDWPKQGCLQREKLSDLFWGEQVLNVLSRLQESFKKNRRRRNFPCMPKKTIQFFMAMVALRPPDPVNLLRACRLPMLQKPAQIAISDEKAEKSALRRRAPSPARERKAPAALQ
jgi:hypothetical protein